MTSLDIEAGDAADSPTLVERMSFSFNKIRSSTRRRAPDGHAQGGTTFRQMTVESTTGRDTHLATPPNAASKDGDPVAALAQLQEQVRARPADAQAAHLPVPAAVRARPVGARAEPARRSPPSSTPQALPMAQTYGDAVRCEAVRDEVFDGKKSPMIFGEPRASGWRC